MAELVVCTDKRALHPELAVFREGLLLPLANSAQSQAALDASTEGFADSEAPYPSSCRFLCQKGCVSQDPSAFLDDPNAHASRLAYSPSVSPYTHGDPEADCKGFSQTVALSKGAQKHLATGNEGLTHPQHFPLKNSTTTCAELDEDAVFSLQKDQVDSSALHGCREGCTSPCVKSNNPHVVWTGSAHVVTKCYDPLVQINMAYVSSCEKSTSSHEEGEDSTAPQGSDKDLSFSHGGCDDSCDSSGGFECAQRAKRDSSNAFGGVQGPFEGQLDPYDQQADVDVSSILQSCSSECSSATSMVTNATSEMTSRLDNFDKNVDGLERHWTDAKHGSYLDYMEKSFVNNLYGREYCALDVCGQQPFRQVQRNSSPGPSPTLFEFKSWQSGDWHRRSMLKPPLLTCIPLALRQSPWVNHFRHRNSSQARHHIKIENVRTSRAINGEGEVNSPLIEVYRGALGHDSVSGSNFGHVERLLCVKGSGAEVAGRVKQDGLQEVARDTEISRFSNTRKRGIELNIEQVPFIRCCGRGTFSKSNWEGR